MLDACGDCCWLICVPIETAAYKRRMAESDRWSIDKLNSSNWMTWKFQLKHLLLSKGLWDIVTGKEVLKENPTTAQEAEFRSRSQKAFSTIVMSMESSQLYLVTSFEEPVGAWKALGDHFERDGTRW